tara:strand:- start:1436 stop:2326 length:891 start_codon:yes stop_codon:yes gene_type:complete
MIRIDAAIIGAEKAGTSALGNYIAMHPDVVSHFGGGEKKGGVLEFSTFVNGRCNDEKAFASDYKSAFGALSFSGKIVVAKNVSLINSEVGLDNVKRFCPDCKIIIIVRNPVERAYSSFFYQKFRGEETLDGFLEAVERELSGGADDLSIERRYLARGYYADQIESVYKRFSKERVLVLLYEDMKQDPQHLMDRVFSFLNLSPYKISNFEKINEAKSARSERLARYLHGHGVVKSMFRLVTSVRLREKILYALRRLNSRPLERNKIDSALSERLSKHFSPENKKLEDLTGLDLKDWK